MLLSTLAGMMIAIGGTVFLSVGDVAGALFFSMGLLSILIFKLELFTGKAGLLATNEIKIGKLVQIWCGNFIGTLTVAFGLLFVPSGPKLSNVAADIIQIRIENGFTANLIYGIGCGILMYIAVKAWSLMSNNPVYAMMPVAIFILCGFTHCVADMFYLHMGAMNYSDYLILIPTTIGNIIGTNVLPVTIKLHTKGN